MPTPLESAVIEIIADVSGFEDSLVPDVRSAMDRAVRIVKDDVADIEGQLNNVNFSRVLEGLDPSSINDAALAAGRLREAFREAGLEGEGVDQAVEHVIASVAQLENAIVAGPQEALRDLDNATDRAAERMRAAFGRTIVAGVENLEESLDDVGNTLRNELRVAAQRAEDSIARLGDIDGLERIEEQIDDLVTAFDVKLEDALRDSRVDIERLAESGEASMEELERAVVGAAVALDERLGNDLTEVRTKLRLLSGEGHVFTEMAADIARVDAELEQADDAADGLRNSLRQAGGAANRLGTRSGGTSRFVANLNRARFIALDLRFILTGLGLALAGRFAEFGIEAASSLEQLDLSLQAIGKSISQDFDRPFTDFADEASASFDKIVASARETPFSIEEVAEATRRLVAFVPSFGVLGDGVDDLNSRTEASIDIFETLGGTLALLGNTEGLNRVIKALGDIGARGKLTGEEIRQLANALPGIDLRETIVRGLAAGVKGFEELNAEIGFTGDNLPQAVERFNELQENGLIPAEAAVQGLIRGMDQLFDTTEALQAFTLTIEGSLEKLREAAQIGVSRGLEPLGKVLSDVLPKALETVEDASESFGEGLTNLAEDIIPLALEGVSELADIMGSLTSATGEFLEENASDFSDAIESSASAVRNLGRTLAPVFADAGPLIARVADTLDQVTRGLEQLSRVGGSAFGGITKTIDRVLQLFNALPDPIQGAATIAIIAFRKEIIALGKAARLAFFNSSASVGTFIASVETAGVALKSIGTRAAAIGKTIGALFVLDTLLSVVDAFDRIDQSASAVNDRVEQLRTKPISQAAGVFNTLDAEAQAARDSLNLIAKKDLPELQDRFEEVSDNPFITGQFLGIFGEKIVDVRDDLDELGLDVKAYNEIIAETGRVNSQLSSRVLPAVNSSLRALDSGFSNTAIRTRLSNEELLAIADLSGPQAAEALENLRTGAITETEAIARLNIAVAKSITQHGGFASAADAAGIDVRKFGNIVSNTSGKGLDFAAAFDAATISLQNFATEQLKTVSPAFALFDSFQAIDEALTAVGEAEGPDELDAAIFDLAATVAASDAAIGVFAESVKNGETSFSDAEETIVGLLGRVEGLGDKSGEVGVIFDGLRSKVTTALKDIGFNSKEIDNVLGPALESGGVSFKELAEEAKQSKRTMGQVFNAIEGDVLTFGGNFNRQMRQSGEDAVAGLIAALEAGRQRTANALAGLGDAAVAGFDRRLLIDSPSKVMMERGRALVEGIQTGITSQVPSLQRTIGELSSVISAPVPGPTLTGFDLPTFGRAATPNGSSTQPQTPTGGINSPITNNFTVNAPSPEAAARRVASEVGDFVYLNGGRIA